MTEINWEKWKSALGFKLEEEHENETMSSETNERESGKTGTVFYICCVVAEKSVTPTVVSPFRNSMELQWFPPENPL